MKCKSNGIEIFSGLWEYFVAAMDKNLSGRVDFFGEMGLPLIPREHSLLCWSMRPTLLLHPPQYRTRPDKFLPLQHPKSWLLWLRIRFCRLLYSWMETLKAILCSKKKTQPRIIIIDGIQSTRSAYVNVCSYILWKSSLIKYSIICVCFQYQCYI